MRWLSTIAEAGDGALTIEKMRLDETGFPQPTGEFEELAADAVVLALGQEPELGLLDGVPGVEFDHGTVRVGPNMMTGHPGVFAGGDMIPSERTVTVAIGHGKKAARNIDAWLRGQDRSPARQRDAGHLRPAQPVVLRRRARHRPAGAGDRPAGRPPSTR